MSKGELKKRQDEYAAIRAAADPPLNLLYKYVQGLSDADLQTLGDEMSKTTQTNCWVVHYHLSHVLGALIRDEQWKRKQPKEQTDDKSKTGAQESPPPAGSEG